MAEEMVNEATKTSDNCATGVVRDDERRKKRTAVIWLQRALMHRGADVGDYDETQDYDLPPLS